MEELNQSENEDTKKEEPPKLLMAFKLDHPLLEQGNKVISGIGSYLPILSVTLLSISLIRVYLYYSYFNINILDYINLSELLSPLIMDLASLIIITLIVITAIFLGKTLSFKFIAFMPQRSNLKVGKKIITNKIVLFINNAISIIITIFLLILPFFILAVSTKNLLNHLNIRIAGYALFTIPALILLYAGFAVIKRTKEIHIIHFVLISLVAVMLVSSIMEGYSLPADFYSNKKLHTTRIIFEDSKEPIKLDSIFVIGLTQDYVFLYNDHVKMSQVRKRIDIKVMSPGVLPLSNSSMYDQTMRK